MRIFRYTGTLGMETGIRICWIVHNLQITVFVEKSISSFKLSFSVSFFIPELPVVTIKRIDKMYWKMLSLPNKNLNNHTTMLIVRQIPPTHFLYRIHICRNVGHHVRVFEMIVVLHFDKHLPKICIVWKRNLRIWEPSQDNFKGYLAIILKLFIHFTFCLEWCAP